MSSLKVNWSKMSFAGRNPAKRQAAEGVVLNDEKFLWFWGGDFGIKHDAWELDPRDKSLVETRLTWPKNDLFPAGKCAMYDDGDVAYLYGGIQESADYDYLSRDIMKLDKKTKTFSRIEPKVRYTIVPNAPMPCYSSTMVLVFNQLWIYGGVNAALKPSAQFFSFDLDTKVWTRYSTSSEDGAPNVERSGKYIAAEGGAPPGRQGHTMNLWKREGHDPILVVFGGVYLSEGKPFRGNDLYFIHLARDRPPRWEYIGPKDKPNGRSHHAATLVQDKLFIFGGYVESHSPPKIDQDVVSRSSVTDELWCFDLIQGTWTKLEISVSRFEDDRLARALPCMKRIGTDVYLFGGNTGKEDGPKHSNGMWKCRICPPFPLAKPVITNLEEHQVTITWEYQYYWQLDKSYVELMDDEGNWSPVNVKVVENKKQFKCTIPNLEPGYPYALRIVAVNSVGSSKSEALPFVTKGERVEIGINQVEDFDGKIHINYSTSKPMLITIEASIAQVSPGPALKKPTNVEYFTLSKQNVPKGTHDEIFDISDRIESHPYTKTAIEQVQGQSAQVAQGKRKRSETVDCLDVEVEVRVSCGKLISKAKVVLRTPPVIPPMQDVVMLEDSTVRSNPDLSDSANPALPIPENQPMYIESPSLDATPEPDPIPKHQLPPKPLPSKAHDGKRKVTKSPERVIPKEPVSEPVPEPAQEPVQPVEQVAVQEPVEPAPQPEDYVEVVLDEPIEPIQETAPKVRKKPGPKPKKTPAPKKGKKIVESPTVESEVSPEIPTETLTVDTTMEALTERVMDSPAPESVASQASKKGRKKKAVDDDYAEASPITRKRTITGAVSMENLKRQASTSVEPTKTARGGRKATKSIVIAPTQSVHLPPLPKEFPHQYAYGDLLEVNIEDEHKVKKWHCARALYYRRARATLIDGKVEEGWALFVNWYGYPPSMDNGFFIDPITLQDMRVLSNAGPEFNEWPVKGGKKKAGQNFPDDLGPIGALDSVKYFAEPNKTYGISTKAQRQAVADLGNVPWVRVDEDHIYGEDVMNGLVDEGVGRFSKFEFWVEEDGEGLWK